MIFTNRWRGIPKKAVAVILAMAIICFSLISQNPAQAQSIDAALNEAKARQAELDKKLESIESELNKLSTSKEKTDARMAWLKNRSAEQKALYQEKLKQLSLAIQEDATANQNYLDAVDLLSNKQIEYQKRLQVMSSFRQKSYLQLFVESENIRNFFSTIQFMSLVASADQQILDDLKSARDDATLKKEISMQKKSEMSLAIENINAQITKLKNETNTTQQQLQSIQDDMNTINQAEDDFNNEAGKLDQEIRDLQKKLAAEQSAKATAAATERAENNTGSSVNSKGWLWPYPADRNTYSPYGWRFHPIYKRNRFHAGSDIGGSYGAPIIAARDGVVILVRNPVQGRNTGGSGYGNYVVIAHDGEYTTLYAHMKETLVQVGQQVKAGDRIGLCGSTGRSTGPHLHFELRIDGSTTDPIPYVC